MLRIVPVVGLSGHLALQALAAGGSGMSEEAFAVRDTADQVARSAEESVALFGAKAAILSQLAELATQETDADPIALINADRFVRALPEGMALPEVAAEPDGWISLDWIKSRNRLFSLSVGSSDRLAYAWLDGSDKGHGVIRFDGKRIPSRILENIKDILA
jgi:hypothetical protein